MQEKDIEIYKEAGEKPKWKRLQPWKADRFYVIHLYEFKNWLDLYWQNHHLCSLNKEQITFFSDIVTSFENFFVELSFLFGWQVALILTKSSYAACSLF